MNLKKYLKDKIYIIILFIPIYLLIFMLLFSFKVNRFLMLSILVILPLYIISILAFEYLREKNFYNDLMTNIKRLDKAYLVLETIDKPNFYEGELLYNALYDINKSMCELVNEKEEQTTDFKEYIEMWIHEVKIPISIVTLTLHNYQGKKGKLILEQLQRIEDYTEQVLYYVRSENASKDFLINEVSLKKSINNIALKNKDYILKNNIDLIVKNIDYKVYSDSKWLEFIINQIVNNSIKYKKDIPNSYIKISVIEKENEYILEIEDNGVGIKESDLPKVFQKSFTGENGRKVKNSTGMGLFIAKKLCIKLGHKITIESV